MKTIIEFIGSVRKNYKDLRVTYVHPVLYVLIIDGELHRLSIDNAEKEFAGKLGLGQVELNQLLADFGVSIAFLGSADASSASPYSFLLGDNSSNNWLPLFDASLRDEWAKSLEKSVALNEFKKGRSLHFYGFKGGQARSTVLLMLAKDLADSGYKVLAVDVDIEAPSLSPLLNANTSSVGATVVGLLRGLEPEVVGVASSHRGGTFDLIPAAPAIADFEMDYASFLVRVTSDPVALQEAIVRLREYAQGAGYDFVLFDHRTGLSTSVLPVLSAWPGSVVIATRPDSALLALKPVISTLLAAYPEFPGVFVNFSLDPESKKGAYSEQEQVLRENLLNILAAAIEQGQEVAGAVDLSAEDLAAYFLSWYHDRAFLSQGVPEIERISKDNQETLASLREVIGIPPISVSTDASSTVDTPGSVASPSGALDEGLFVETPGATRVLQPNLPSFYVFGRKGTGKTRLFRELDKRGLGFPLHSAADLKRGLQSQSSTAKTLISRVQGDLEKFWWTLLSAALKSGGDEKAYMDALKDWLDDPSFSGVESAVVAGQLESRVGYFTFLIDGVETAVEAAKTGALVEALFRFLSTLQNDPGFSSKLRFRLFIRSDLPVGIQNVEQQVHGRRVDLRWDESSIFHYVLAEISRNGWFRSNFEDTCRKIESDRSRIQSVSLDSSEYEDLLLKVFPRKLRRNNLLTMTFFRTYFSDAAGEGDSRSSFYPRVFGSFLSRLEVVGSVEPSSALDGDKRVSHAVVLDAFSDAARDFISEVRQELSFALELSVDQEENRKLVNDMMQAFSGLTTPFELDPFVDRLAGRLTSTVSAGGLRESLRRMKDMGIFEVHPSDASKWRAGRLFKEGLGMKYVR